jgi:hypothetical protein
VGPSGDQANKAREELTYCRVLKIVAVSLLIAGVNFAIARKIERTHRWTPPNRNNSGWKSGIYDLPVTKRTIVTSPA